MNKNLKSVASSYNSAGHDRSNVDNNLEFLKSQNIPKGSKILEVGCGTGTTSRWLYDNISEDVVGIDISESGINFARENSDKVKYFLMSGDDLNFEENKFDIVISFDLVEHIPNIQKHFSEVSRVLKPGGRYIFATPNKWTNIPWEIVQTRSFKYKEEHPSLLNLFELKDTLKKHGFDYEVIKMKVITPFRINLVKERLGTLASIIFKYSPLDILPLPISTNFFVNATKAKK
ncbi:class I SAM-dependent methyltransferase [Halobacteriovorax sp.]|uniref:class I SAM-dependent methyltransferase n=1 Tax=Halobacteriovorax sp. TaxID=2020862 RepID=UPI003AF2FD8F